MELSIFGELCRSVLATALFYGFMLILQRELSTGFFAMFLVGHFLGSLIYRFIKAKLTKPPVQG